MVNPWQNIQKSELMATGSHADSSFYGTYTSLRSTTYGDSHIRESAGGLRLRRKRGGGGT